jgi:hypothetical protein
VSTQTTERTQLPQRVPAAPVSKTSAAELRATTETAYIQRDRQLAEAVRADLTAGGMR